MKKLGYLVVLVLALLVVPFMVYADGEKTTTSNKNEVKVYLFRGEGCPHCADAEEFFNSIEEEYGSMFEVIDYETWYDEENKELMDKVAEARKEEAGGVPYIIVGNKSGNGYTDSYGEEILAEIKSEYEKPIKDRYDIMKLIGNVKKEKGSNDVIALIIILVATTGIVFGVYKARNNTNFIAKWRKFFFYRIRTL